jgi:hypothetical protein
MLVDLTVEAPEAELAAAQAELEAQERAEDEAQRAAALANKRKTLEDALVGALELGWGWGGGGCVFLGEGG